MYRGEVMERGTLRRHLRAPAASLSQGAAAGGAALRHEAGRAAASDARDRSTHAARRRSWRQQSRGRGAGAGTVLDGRGISQDLRPASDRLARAPAKADACPRGRRCQLRDHARRVPRPGRRKRLRQDHAVARSSCARSTPDAATVSSSTTAARLRRRARPDGDGARCASAARVQFIFQDPFGSLNPRMTVDDILRRAARSSMTSAMRRRPRRAGRRS